MSAASDGWPAASDGNEICLLLPVAVLLDVAVFWPVLDGVAVFGAPAPTFCFQMALFSCLFSFNSSSFSCNLFRQLPILSAWSQCVSTGRSILRCLDTDFSLQRARRRMSEDGIWITESGRQQAAEHSFGYGPYWLAYLHCLIYFLASLLTSEYTCLFETALRALDLDASNAASFAQSDQ